MSIIECILFSEQLDPFNNILNNKDGLTTIPSATPTLTTECNPNPCLNTGICVLNASGKFHGCFCPTSYTGRFCQENNCKKFVFSKMKKSLLHYKFSLIDYSFSLQLKHFANAL